MSDPNSTVEAMLRAEILSGKYAPGERLGEVALAAEFNVGRSKVREALRHLDQIGIVSFTPNAGAKVKQLSRADIAANYELRELLEVRAVELAARNGSDDELGRLEPLLDRHEAEISAAPDGFYRQSNIDNDFHALIARMSGNPVLVRLLTEVLHPQILLYRVHIQRANDMRSPGRGVRALAEHRAIAAALKERDGELAGLLMRRHIVNSLQGLQTLLKGS